MENETLATEMLRELKASNHRWFIAFIVALALWFLTIGAFIFYLCLPVEEVTIEQDTDGNANYLIGIGDYNASDDNIQEETYTQEEEVNANE